MKLQAITGAIRGVEVCNMNILIVGNHVRASAYLANHYITANINFAHGNMSVWRSYKDDIPHTISIWSEESIEDGNIIASKGGILIDVYGSWDKALELYTSINDLLEYDPDYFL